MKEIIFRDLDNRDNADKKENVGHKLQYEIIEHGKTKYKDPLIRGSYHDYWDNYSRKEVCLNDAIGEKITKGFMTRIFMKYPKFTANDEVQTPYIMEDVRKAIQLLNLKGVFIDIGTNCIISGYCLAKWDIKQPNKREEGEEEKQDQSYSLTVKLFGWDECHPRFWTRFMQPALANKIYKYKAYYVPYPTGREAAHYGMKMERHIMFPQDLNFQHLARVSWNYGLGHARVQPIWDAITKLRERSDSEHFRSSNFLEARYPQSYSATGQATKFMEKVRQSSRTMGLAVEEYMNPKSGEPTGLPNVVYRPWAQGTTGSPFDINKGAGFLDNEWARLLCNLEYTQVWAVGAQAGQQEGSEINLTRDDRSDIAEFSILGSVFKKVLKKLCELGVFDLLEISEDSKKLLLTEEYQIVCWKTWEYNDKMQLQQQQALMQHQLEDKRGTDDDRNAYDQEKKEQKALINNQQILEDRLNERVHIQIIFALRFNVDMPMTPIMSSWAEKAGVYKGQLLIKYHDEPDIFGYAYGGMGEGRGSEKAMEEYLSMMESTSKGGWIWDNILVRGGWQGKPFTKGTTIQHQEPPGRPARFKYQPVPDFGTAGFGTPEEMREFKMKGKEELGVKGLGTSIEPFPLPKQETKWKEVWESQGQKQTLMEKQSETKYPSAESYGIKPIWNPTKVRAQALPDISELSRKKFNELAKSLGVDTFGSPTIDKVKTLLRKADKYRENHQVRYNSISMGNPMAFGFPLYYDIEDKISEEYPCSDAFRKIENHEGNLWLYEDLGHSGEKISVGTYEYLGFADDLEVPIVLFDYDEDLIRSFIRNQGKYDNSEIIKRLDAKLEPEMSTEYYCKVVNRDGKKYQTNFRNSLGQPRFEGIAIVEMGNCPSGRCDFERVNYAYKKPKTKHIGEYTIEMSFPSYKRALGMVWKGDDFPQYFQGGNKEENVLEWYRSMKNITTVREWHEKAIALDIAEQKEKESWKKDEKGEKWITVDGGTDKSRHVKINKYRENPFAGFENFDSCMKKMRGKYDEETAKKVCGKLQSKYEKKNVGRWITVKGTHIFIEEGESLEHAISKLVEKTGFERERAKREIRHVKPEKKKEPKKKEPGKMEQRKTLQIQKKLAKVKSMKDPNLDKTIMIISAFLLNPLNPLKALSAITSEISRIKRAKNINQEKKDDLLEQINILKKEIEIYRK